MSQQTTAYRWSNEFDKQALGRRLTGADRDLAVALVETLNGWKRGEDGLRKTCLADFLDGVYALPSAKRELKKLILSHVLGEALEAITHIDHLPPDKEVLVQRLLRDLPPLVEQLRDTNGVDLVQAEGNLDYLIELDRSRHYSGTFGDELREIASVCMAVLSAELVPIGKRSTVRSSRSGVAVGRCQGSARNGGNRGNGHLRQ